MRAWDITVLVICFELALQVVVGAQLYAPGTTFYEPSKESIIDVDGYTSGDMNATSNLIESGKARNSDMFSLTMGLVTALNVFLRVISSVVWFVPHLRDTFGCPLVIAIPIQALIYLSYAIGLIQFWSGRSTNLMS